MTTIEDPRQHRFALNDGSSEIPALGFGTSLSDRTKTVSAVKTAVQVGFRHLDAAERYRNEAEVGVALKELFAEGTVRREDLFVTTKLWNNNHRPERVKPALQASLGKLGLDAVDLYLVHTPFAFQPGDDQDPRDPHGAVVYDDGVTLKETWASLDRLVCPISTLKAPARSSRAPGSRRRSWRSSRTRITRNGSFTSSTRPTGSSCWRSRRWGTHWSRGCWTTR
jgi:hypothetical protein